MSLFSYFAVILNNRIVPNRQGFQLNCDWKQPVFLDSCYQRKDPKQSHTQGLLGFPPVRLSPHDCVKKILTNIWISVIFGLFFWRNTKTSCNVHKNVSVYCVEFQYTKKQTILLLEVWHKPYYSKFQRFILLASFYLSSTSHNDITTKTKISGFHES